VIERKSERVRGKEGEEEGKMKGERGRNRGEERARLVERE